MAVEMGVLITLIGLVLALQVGIFSQIANFRVEVARGQERRKIR